MPEGLTQQPDYENEQNNIDDKITTEDIESFEPGVQSSGVATTDKPWDQEKAVETFGPSEAAMLKLKNCAELLSFYDQQRYYYYPIGKAPKGREFADSMFNLSPTLFSKVRDIDVESAKDIARGGLSTPLYRNRLQGRETQDFYGNRYNHAYISLTWIPWWGSPQLERYAQGEQVGKGYYLENNGKLSNLTLSIGLDPAEGKEILKKNRDSSIFSEKVEGEVIASMQERYATLNEVVAPLHIGSENFSAIFVQTGIGREQVDISEEEQRVFYNVVSDIGEVAGIPIFNFYGDLLWPKQMDYEKVKQFVAERDAQKEHDSGSPES